MAEYEVRFSEDVSVHDTCDGETVISDGFGFFSPAGARQFAQALLDAADMADTINGH